MNIIEYYLSITFLSVCGLFFSLFPVDEQKVVFASARDNKPTGNLAALLTAYKKRYPDGKNVILFRTYSYGLWGKISYLFSLVKTTYHLKTAHYFFIDNALFPVHVIPHRKKTKVIQVWHATGALKKFGLDTPVEERKVENRFLHRGYDFVIADSEPTRQAYATAFGISEDRILGLGSPRTDTLLAPDARQKARTLLLTEHPGLAGKILLLFAPTFRGFSADKSAAQTFNVESLKNALGSNYAVVYKPHTVIKESPDTHFDAVLSSKNDLNVYLPAFDGLITDYSSVLFEAALLGMPLFKICGDLKDYLKQNGFYIDYLRDIPGANCRTTDELSDAIKETHINTRMPELAQTEYRAFAARFCTYSKGHTCEAILSEFPLADGERKQST
ncbi:MAG: CDP-glycerol glycerophosphotransferase family protein [Coriobacteriia bacterium]|nr:CDP-glycerol glycerophosphotransferase family protein [Coriobacteriia bacterium]